MLNLDSLNLDIIYRILDCLEEEDRSNLRLLNKRWKDLITGYRRHQRELSYCCRFKSFNERRYRSCDLRWFINEFPNIRSLCLDLDFLVERQRTKFLGNHEWLLKIVNAWQRLEEFKLLVPGRLIDGTRLDYLNGLRYLRQLHIECVIDATQFASVLEKCKSLRRLTFNNRGRSSGRGLATAFAGLHDNLEAIWFKTHSSTSVENCLTHLISKNPSLKEISIGLAPTYPSMLTRICQSFKKLEVLEFNEINNNFSPPQFAPLQPPNNYIPLNELAENIQALNAQQNVGQDGYTWHRLKQVPLDTLPNLRVFRACCRIRTTEATSLVNRLAKYHQIERLHLEFQAMPIVQSNSFISTVCASCPKLKHLTLFGFKSMCFLNALEELSQLRQLHTLELKFRQKIYSQNFSLAWRTHHDKFARTLQKISLSSFALDETVPLSVWGPLHRKARNYHRIITIRIFTCSQGTQLFKIGDVCSEAADKLDEQHSKNSQERSSSLDAGSAMATTSSSSSDSTPIPTTSTTTPV